MIVKGYKYSSFIVALHTLSLSPLLSSSLSLLGRPQWLAHGLVNLVAAVAYHFCLYLPASFSTTCEQFAGAQYLRGTIKYVNEGSKTVNSLLANDRCWSQGLWARPGDGCVNNNN